MGVRGEVRAQSRAEGPDQERAAPASSATGDAGSGVAAMAASIRSTSQAVASSMSRAVSPVTISPWFASSVSRGGGVPVRASCSARAARMALARGRPGSV